MTIAGIRRETTEISNGDSYWICWRGLSATYQLQWTGTQSISKFKATFQYLLPTLKWLNGTLHIQKRSERERGHADGTSMEKVWIDSSVHRVGRNRENYGLPLVFCQISHVGCWLVRNENRVTMLCFLFNTCFIGYVRVTGRLHDITTLFGTEYNVLHVLHGYVSH